jgi:HK97 family phage portal protein
VLVRRALGAFEQRGAPGGLPFGDSTPPSNGMLGGSFAGTDVSERTVLRHATVYGSVSLLSDSIATLPVRQWCGTPGADPSEVSLAPVIAQPWSEITRRDFVTQGTMSMLLRGNLWGQIISTDDLGFPTQVQLVHPDHAAVRRLSDGTLQFRYWGQIVPSSKVTRAMALSVPEGMLGINPIENLRSAFGLARAQDLYAGAFFANSARPDGWIGVDDDLEPDETRAMLSAWNAAHQGINQSHLPAILTGGAKWNAITMSMADAQFLEQVQLSESVISGRIYRIPPHMLGMVDKDTSWGAGIEQQEQGFVTNTLMPWLYRWEDLFSSWLPKGQFVTFDLSQRLRGDTLQRWSAYQIARTMGAMNNIEVRAAEGLPAVTDPAASAILEAYDAPLNSAPMKPLSSSGAGPGGDKAD